VVGGKTEPVSVIAGTSTTIGLGGSIVSIESFGGKPKRGYWKHEYKDKFNYRA
jgi:hypothetical protein